VATLTGYDGFGRTTLVTQTGILTGAITLSNGLPTFTGTTTRVTRTQYDTLSRPITVTENYQPAINGGIFHANAPDVNLQTITQYDADGNIILERDTAGRWTFTEFDALNRPITVTLNYENGNPLTVDAAHAGWSDLAHTDIVRVSRYSPTGQLERTIENYVAPGLFTATAPLTNRITLYQYDIQDRVITTTLNYDPVTLTTRTDTNLTTATAFDPVTGWRVGMQDASGRWTHMDYDAFGRVTQQVANCRTSAGIPTATACAPFNPQGRLDRNVPNLTRYDVLGRPEETEDAQGHVTRRTTNRLTRTTTTIQNYVPNTAPTTTTNVLSLQTVDAVGRTILLTDTVVTTTTVDYRVVRSSYDALGRTHTTISPVGTTRFASNGLGNTVIMTDTAGRVTRSGYDGTGTLRWQQRHDGQLTIYHVDGMGRVATTIHNYQNGLVDAGETADRDIIMATRYDAAGRAVWTTDLGRRATASVYNRLDQLISVTENATTSSCVNAPCNVPTQYHYDRMGNRIAIIDALARVRRFTYDAAGRQVTATDAANVTTAWSYDKLGRKTLQDDPRGASYDLQFAYDELDRITQTLALNLPTPITAQYDALGQRTQLVDGSGTTTFAYNPLGYLTTVGRTDGTVGYAYTSQGERTRLRYPDGASIDYRYDGSGRLQQVRDATSTLATYGYDMAGRLATLTRVNGATTTYGYDAADRAVRQTTQAGTTVLSDFQYQLTAAGQRTVVTETLPLLVGQNGARAAAPGAATTPTTTWLPTMLQGGASTPAGPTAPTADRLPAGSPAPAVDQAALAARLADAPLSFVPNRGQTAQAVQFHAQSAAGTVFFTRDAVVFAIPTPLTRTAGRYPVALPDPSAASQASGRTTAVHMTFRAAGSSTLTGVNALPGTVHYLRGKNQAQWQQNLPTYGGVRYDGLYPNIGAIFTGTAGLLKSTYIVTPTGNPTQIRWHYPEATDVRLDAQGDLTITIADAAPGQGRAPERAPITLHESAPVAWQVIAGQQVPVSVSYTVTVAHDIGFVVGTYDAAYPLIIDPSLTYSTALGGGAADYASALTVDASGNTYMTGSTASIDFPDMGTLSGTRGTGMEAFVTKLTASGGGYSFYLGGSGNDVASRRTPAAMPMSSGAPTRPTFRSAHPPTSCPIRTLALAPAGTMPLSPRSTRPGRRCSIAPTSAALVTTLVARLRSIAAATPISPVLPTRRASRPLPRASPVLRATTTPFWPS
jgi:YD repeat-containing protein